MSAVRIYNRPGVVLAALTCWLLWLTAAEAVLAAEAVAPAGTAADVPVADAPATDVTVRSQEALATLDRVRSQVNALGEPEQQIAELEDLREQVEALLPAGGSVDELVDDPAEIDGILVRSRNLTNRSGALIDGLTASAEQIEGYLAEVNTLSARWEERRRDGGSLPQALSGRIDDILESARDLQQQLDARLERVIRLQDDAMAVRSALTPISERIDHYGRSLQTQRFEQNVPRLWKITTEHLSRSSERSTRIFTGTFRADFQTWLQTSETAIGGHFLLLPAILLLLFRLRARTPSPGAALARPVPTGVLIWMLIGVAIYAGAPTGVRVIYVVIAMLAATAVLMVAVPRTIRGGVLLFVAIALVHEFVESLPVLEHLPRIAYLFFAVALMVLGWFARHRDATQAVVDWGSPRGLIVTALTLFVFLLAISIIANVLGYMVLAKHLVVGVINSVSVFLVLFAGFSSVSEIVQVVLRLPMLDGIRSITANRFRLERMLRRPLVWLSLALWLWATLRAFGLDGWLFGSVRELVQAEVSFGSVTLSLGGVLLFVFAVWLAVWSSRMVRAVLNLDVFPRMSLPRGVPNTISMTVHYSIILLGLLLGFGSMGVDLSNLAFIVGALGVGIGFGLQNVVNNFVSGLILIFEAPIQVGDTVEVGSLMGRVTQIGIRTSRVRTYDGSEVIVPNGDLVSNQVINWTLSDRQRRIELNVGVAYGSDPEQVAALLRSVLEADADVLKEPQPMVIFAGFGDSALNFRMLAWIADFDQGFTMTHRLNSAINAALAEAGISIPFPQRDLHVRSLPEAAAPTSGSDDGPPGTAPPS
ncbi:MAG: mechanosensitive ion channel domain-containing protein [Pseudomonadales bacterium]